MMTEEILITIVQTDLVWEDKAKNLEILKQKIMGIREKTHVVFLPEMFTTGFSMEPARLAENMDGDTIKWMKEIAASKRVILAGSFIAEDNGHYFNRLIWMLPTGEYGKYDKRHRFAFAGEDKSYTSGSSRCIAKVNGWRFNLMVCYDLRFPVWARQQSTEEGAEYDVLVYVANWPEKRIHAWQTLLKARAIENQCYVIGVNRVGVDGKQINYNGSSMLIDPLGEVLYQKEQAEDIVTLALNRQHLQKIREQFPFLKDQDLFQIITE